MPLFRVDSVAMPFCDISGWAYKSHQDMPFATRESNNWSSSWTESDNVQPHRSSASVKPIGCDFVPTSQRCGPTSSV